MLLFSKLGLRILSISGIYSRMLVSSEGNSESANYLLFLPICYFRKLLGNKYVTYKISNLCIHQLSKLYNITANADEIE